MPTPSPTPPGPSLEDTEPALIQRLQELMAAYGPLGVARAVDNIRKNYRRVFQDTDDLVDWSTVRGSRRPDQTTREQVHDIARSMLEEPDRVDGQGRADWHAMSTSYRAALTSIYNITVPTRPIDITRRPDALPVRLEIVTRKPDKYRLVDTETGQVWKHASGSEVYWVAANDLDCTLVPPPTRRQQQLLDFLDETNADAAEAAATSRFTFKGGPGTPERSG